MDYLTAVVLEVLFDIKAGSPPCLGRGVVGLHQPRGVTNKSLVYTTEMSIGVLMSITGTVPDPFSPSY